MKSISLARKSEGMSMPEDPHYPSLYFDHPEPIELPDEGEMKISFRVRRRTKEETNGKKRCSYDLDILSITPPKVGSKSKSAEETIDELYESTKK